MKNARLLIAVYECAEDAMAVGVSTKQMWDDDYRKAFGVNYSEDQLDHIISLIDTVVDMINDIGYDLKDINEEIDRLEKKLCINVMTRINFMIEYDIPFNVIKGKDDLTYDVTYDKESAGKYLAFLQSLPE